MDKEMKVEVKKMIRTMSMRKKILSLCFIIIIAVLGVIFIQQKFFAPDNQPEIISESQLYKIVNVSELSTYQCVYNDIYTEKDSTDPSKILYHVAYKSKVKAGIDFTKIAITINDKTDEEKIVKITLPKVNITEVNVDINSLDFIWEDSDAETETVYADAYQKCVEDVTQKANSEHQIFDLAQENAEKMVKALVDPFIEQANSDDMTYRLEIISLTEEENK